MAAPAAVEATLSASCVLAVGRPVHYAFTLPTTAQSPVDCRPGVSATSALSYGPGRAAVTEAPGIKAPDEGYRCRGRQTTSVLAAAINDRGRQKATQTGAALLAS